MKKIIVTFFAAMFAAAALFAQTPEEIIARMDQETNRFDSEGCSMVMEMKIPLLGSFSTTVYMFGNKFKMVTDVKGKKAVNWSDGKTEWMYEPEKNEVTVTTAKASEKSEAESNMDMLSGVTEGYDVKLKNETDQAWYFRCTKSKTNTNKDDPKSMDLVISKTTYLPLSASVREKGITVTLRDFAVGVKEGDVTFRPSDYPGVKIIDQR